MIFTIALLYILVWRLTPESHGAFAYLLTQARQRRINLFNQNSKNQALELSRQLAGFVFSI